MLQQQHITLMLQQQHACVILQILEWYLMPNATMCTTALDMMKANEMRVHQRIKSQVYDFRKPAARLLPEAEAESDSDDENPYLTKNMHAVLNNSRWRVKQWVPAEADLQARETFRNRKTILMYYLAYLTYDLHMDADVIRAASDKLLALPRKDWYDAVHAARRKRSVGF